MGCVVTTVESVGDALRVLTGPEEFYRLTRAILEESADNGVIYTETFLSPDLDFLEFKGPEF